MYAPADQCVEPRLVDDDVSDEREPTAAEVLAGRRDDVVLPEAEATPEEFPYLTNMSAGFLFGGAVRPLEPASPEYVTLSMPYASDREFVAVAEWNMSLAWLVMLTDLYGGSGPTAGLGQRWLSGAVGW